LCDWARNRELYAVLTDSMREVVRQATIHRR
jgi:hypothetical protein